MKFHRINALMIRHLYLYRRSFPRILDLFFWPIMELLLWGFLSVYLDKLDVGGLNLLTLLLGAIIFWDLLSQSQRAVSFAFFEDVWERNLLNLFVTPLRVSEFIVSTGLLGMVRVLVVGAVMAGLAILLYQFNIFQFGLLLIPFVLNLAIFGWLLGVFTTGIILRYGSAANALAFGFIFLVQPFSAVFYPVSALPDGIEWVAYLIPSTYVFEGMRAVVATGAFPGVELVWGVIANIVFAVFVMWYFHRTFAHVKKHGRLMKLD